MKTLNQVKDELIEITMSCNLAECKSTLNAIIEANNLKLKFNTFYSFQGDVEEQKEIAKLEIEAAQEILNNLK